MNEEQKKVFYSLSQSATIVDSIMLPLHQAGTTIFCFEGPLGAGKTTLLQHFFSALGIKEHVVSPTYAYVKEYKDSRGHVVVHFDLYRLESVESFFELGFDRYLEEAVNGNAIVCIEWPALLFELFLQEQFAPVVTVLELNYRAESMSQRELVVRPLK